MCKESKQSDNISPSKKDLGTFDVNHILTIYTDAKNDYRNALGLEQTILNFTASILAIFIAAGFAVLTATNKTAENRYLVWMIFSIISPFFLSLINILYMHQKHRSKTYKYFILQLEQTYMNELVTFENWKEKSVDPFIQNRTAFKFGAVSIALVDPFLFMVIGFIFYQPTCKDIILLILFAGSFLVAIMAMIVSIRYLLAIKHLSNRAKT